MLSDLGAVVLDLDAVARQIRNNDAEARRRIEARFGTIDAGSLGRVVFADPEALRDLEAILHPLVRNETRARLAELEAAGIEAACIEAIKLLESPLHDRCDSTWVVRCDPADAVRRLAATRGMSEDDARARLANQSPQEEKVAAADVVIDGSAPIEETRRQVEEAYRILLAGQGSGA
jgi:dephospho-CoA kinase